MTYGLKISTSICTCISMGRGHAPLASGAWSVFTVASLAVPRMPSSNLHKESEMDKSITVLPKEGLN